MGLKLQTAPTMDPVTVAELKLWARISGTAEDTPLARSISDATFDVETKTGVQCVQATYKLYLDRFPLKTQKNPRGAISLPKPPLQSVTSITYLDGAGTSQTLSTSLYSVYSGSDIERAYIVPAYGQVWPETYDMPEAVTVLFVTGWPVTAGVATTPNDIKEWIIFNATTKYNYRETVYAGLNTVEELPRSFVDGKLDRWIGAKGL